MTTARLLQPAATTSPPLPRERAAHDGERDGEVHEPACAVCDHDLADHDPIGLRYCRATQAQALARKCICPLL
jgi:hypothetical protein